MMAASRGSRRPWRAVLAAALVLPAACGPDGERPSRLARYRLADELPATRPGEVRWATVGDVTRPALSGLAPVPLPLVGWSIVAGDAAGVADITVECPAAVAGERLVAEIVLTNLDEVEGDRGPSGHGRHQAEEIRCPVGEATTLPLRLVGLEPATRTWPLVTGHRPPARRVETPWLVLERGARLRLAIGIASPTPVEDAAPGLFSIRAHGRRGNRVSVLERTLDPAHRPDDRGWVELELPLDAAREQLGPDVRLVFEAGPAGEAGALAFPVWGDPTISVPAGGRRRARRRNVILVSLDALRADRLGCYGFPRPTSPNLDRVAAGGTLFERAITQANWTLPSHATMLTGVNPCVHGYERGSHKRSLRPLPDGVTPLAEILRREGYATAAFTEDAYVDPMVFARGFDLFRADTRLVGAGPEGLIEDTLAGAAAWLRAHAREEVFLFVHTYQVHAPYDPPPRFVDLVRDDGTPWPAGWLRPSAAAAADAAAYAAEVRYTDTALAALLGIVEELGLSGQTILVVTSDHGESFGEHGATRHGFGLFEEELRVPLIWNAPGLVTAGRRVRALVGLVDVTPTILDLLGLPVPPWMQGTSLRPLLTNGTVSPELEARILYTTSLSGSGALTAPSWRAVFRREKPRVFLTETDPQESEPVASPEWETRVAEARRQLDADCERARKLLGAGPAPEPAQEVRGAHDAERERKLRALGYVE